jgi:hypothetical protein
MSHLCCQCQQHKHFSFNNIRFTRRSIVKSVCVVTVVAVSLHYRQQKYRLKTLMGREPSLMCDSSLSFPLGPPVYVSTGLLCGKIGMAIAPSLTVESVHLPHCHRHPLRQSQWTKLTCRTGDNRLFGGMVGIVTPLVPIPTDVTWHSTFIAVSVNSQFIYYTWLQQTPPVAWSTHFTPTMCCW